jgi:CRP-like cAMP-binding protein
MKPGEAITKAPIFQHLSRPSLESIAKEAKVQRFAPGALLVTEGEDAVAFFVIVNGEAEVVKATASGSVVSRQARPPRLLWRNGSPGRVSAIGERARH